MEQAEGTQDGCYSRLKESFILRVVVEWPSRIECTSVKNEFGRMFGR